MTSRNDQNDNELSPTQLDQGDDVLSQRVRDATPASELDADLSLAEFLRSPGDAPALLDDELGKLLRNAKPSVTVVLDCCWAGGMPAKNVGGYAIRLRTSPTSAGNRRRRPRVRGLTPPFWRRCLSLIASALLQLPRERADRAPIASALLQATRPRADRALVDASGGRIVIHGACNVRERAYEDQFDDERYRWVGVYTKHFVDALANAKRKNAALTHEQLRAETERRMAASSEAAELPAQHPIVYPIECELLFPLS